MLQEAVSECSGLRADLQHPWQSVAESTRQTKARRGQSRHIGGSTVRKSSARADHSFQQTPQCPSGTVCQFDLGRQGVPDALHHGNYVVYRLQTNTGFCALLRTLKSQCERRLSSARRDSLVRKREAEHIASRADCDMLHAINRVRHRRRTE